MKLRSWGLTAACSGMTVLLGVAGCDMGSGWYRDARELKKAKQMRIRELESQGLTSEQAERQWNLELSIRQTETPPASGNAR